MCASASQTHQTLNKTSIDRKKIQGGEKIFFSVSWVSVQWLSWIIWLWRKGIYYVRLVRRPWKICVPLSSFATQLLGLVNKVRFEHALMLNCQDAITEDLINPRKVTVQGLLNYSWDRDMQLVFSYSNCIYCLETHSFIDWSPLSHISKLQLHVVVATNPHNSECSFCFSLTHWLSVFVSREYETMQTSKTGSLSLHSFLCGLFVTWTF